MKRFLVLVLLLLLSGCGSDRSSGQSSEKVALSGVVRVGPTPGPCMANTPCSLPAVDVELEFVRSGQSVVDVSTDERGHYEVRLEPGTYRIRVPKYPLPATIQPTSVTVEDDRQINVEIDSGVR